MASSTIKFLNREKSSFYTVLKERVECHFRDTAQPRHGGRTMLLKGGVMLALLLVPYALMLSNLFPVPVMVGLFALMGVGVAGVGMGVMHDANHGSFSGRAWVNNVFSASLYLLGGNVTNWKRQHNVQHHMFTNIHHHDEDITGKPLLRLSFADRLKRVHRYQHVYAFALYGLMTVAFFGKDFWQLLRHVKASKKQGQPWLMNREVQLLVISKIGYVLFIMVAPLTLTALTFGPWLLGFLLMHVVASVIMSIVFQLAHIVEDVTPPVQNEQGNVENAWAIHQLNTTANFRCPRLLSWYIGGLDYQVEHHLFPTISHIHYPALAPIVQATAATYGIPYNQLQSVPAALGSHVRMLRKLGREA